MTMKVDGAFFARLRRLLRLIIQPDTESADTHAYGSLFERMQTLPRLSMVLLVLSFLVEVFAYLSGTRVSEIYPSLSTKDLPRFLTLLATVTALYTTFAALYVARLWIQGCLLIVIRRRLTRILHDLFVTKNNLYDITCIISSASGASNFPVTKDSGDGTDPTPRLVFASETEGESSSPASSFNAFASVDTENEDSDLMDERILLLPNVGNARPGDPQAGPSKLDNPDQTIAHDAEKFSEMVAQITIDAITVPFLIVYYTIETYKITGTIWSAIIITLFFLVSWSVCRLAMNPVVPAVYAKEKLEGDFRFNHVHVRTEAEAIAMMHTESSEKRRLDSLLDSVIEISYKVIWKKAPLNYAMELTMYLAAIVSYVVVSVPVFDGTFDDKSEAEISGIVAKNLFVCLYLIHQFTIITKLADKLSELSGYTTRICMLLEACDDLTEKRMQVEADKAFTRIHRSGDTETFENDSHMASLLLQVKNLTPLVHNDTSLQGDHYVNARMHESLSLNFSIYEGQHTLIMGPSGSGKSSLLRILSRVWIPQVVAGKSIQFHKSLVPTLSDNEHDATTAFHPSNVMFLPQQGFVVPVTPQRRIVTTSPLRNRRSNARTRAPTVENPLIPLIAQITYPDHPEDTDISNLEVTQILGRLGLGHLVQRCFSLQREYSNAAEDGFVNGLSGGEKQRLQIARVLYWKPRLLFMDESLSAVDGERELDLYSVLMSEEFRVTVVSVSHNVSDHVSALFSQKILLNSVDDN
ncbi:ABC transporter transmembrane region 2-domain-containing protein [Chytriomyces sp. MP71]|nr:ABC transporter transmembrane region 2-domain-containing protein [Chytriomyces sp. MP71]